MKLDFYTVLIVFCVITLILGLIIYFFQQKFFFHPEKLPKDFKFAYDNLHAEELTAETEPGVFISYLHFKTEHPKGIVFYLKGNTKSIKGWGKFAIDFTRLQYDVIMLDYRGFGKSTGKRTSEGLKHDIRFIYNLVKQQVPEDRLVVYGRSLGTPFAAMLAAKNNPRLLILNAPIYSLERSINRYLPWLPAKYFMRFNLPTYKYLRGVKCPIKIIHGSDDKLVPVKTAIELSEIQPENTRLYIILKAGHINVHTFKEYHRVLDEVFEDIEEPEKEINFQNTSMNINHRS
ncbi:pimeloyl-ACP methyl ester carboxylesterase [Chryseobacterium defluvii]|uniref:Pimeloyl-ACP methyl ester carboxylesterase n=1 Tax=Chryseobacterium defluvii TaxID=160396 RepID=A0A840KDM3_9FLAO|nr:alpha/beta hydrolase [Chryseobacterium defluvii]MBB4805643.1 pimeloyl-ACP methyl ester carboxylesterase [Chryseobacterium defluvii]